MSLPIGLQVLRAKIRGFQSAGTTITSRISKSEKERKNRLWNEKRLLGYFARHHLVAYGLLRGVPYDRIERCAQNNQLDPQRLFDIIKAHDGWDSRFPGRRFDLESVKKLLIPAIASVTSVAASEPSLKPTGSLSECPQTALRKVS